MPGASNLKGRFRRGVFGVAAGVAETTEADNTAKDVSGSSVNVPNKPGPPLTYRYKLAGTNTGTNGSIQVLLVLGATTLMTLTAEATTASDWIAEFIVTFKDHKTQKIMGSLLQEAEDTAVDFADGTVDCTAGGVLKAQVKAGHADDSITCEMCIIEFGD